MRFLEIVTKLGGSAKDEIEKELLRSYYERLRDMVRNECTNDELEHRFCLMMCGYIMWYIDNSVDYKQTSSDYYLQFLSTRIGVEATT